MCDTYSFGQSSEIIQQNEYSSANNMVQFTDQRLRVELLEMQLQESQQREKNQIKINEQLYKAFQEADQQLKDISEGTNKKKEFQFILEQHDKYIQSLKESYDIQISKLRAELDSIIQENEELKKANQSLEDQKFTIWGDKESKQQTLTQENHLMQQQIKMLREEISLYKSNSELANQKFENDVKLKYQKFAQEERQKLENEIMQIQQNHKNELLRLQDQNQQNEILWNKKLDIANQQRAIMEKYKANDQMLYEMHKENTLEELQTLKKVNYEQSIQIDKLKSTNHELQGQVIKLQETQKELNEYKKNKIQYEELQLNFKDLESKYVEEKAENDMLKKNLQNIQYEMKSSIIEQQFQKEELKKQLTHERKKSVDLNNKIHENQEDYLKKKSAIVKEILQQDNKIKELSKQLTKSQLISQQQSQQIRQSLILNQQNAFQPFSPSSDKDAVQNISNILNLNSSQQNIQFSSSSYINIPQQTQTAQLNSPHLQALNDTILQNQNSSKNFKLDQEEKALQQNNLKEQKQKTLQPSKSNNQISCIKQSAKIKQQISLQNKNEQNVSILRSPSYFQAKKKISFDNHSQQQQTSKKETRKSNILQHQPNNISIQKSPSAYLKRSVSRNGINSDQQLNNKSLRENNSNMEEKRVSLNTTYNAITNNSNNNSICLNNQISPKDNLYQFKFSSKYSTNKANLKNKNLSNQPSLNNSSSNNTEALIQITKQGFDNNQACNSNTSKAATYQTINQNQNLSVAQIIKTHSNSQHNLQENNQSYNLNGQFLQHQMSFNHNLLNDSSLGKMSFLNSVTPNNNNISSYSQQDNNNLQSEQCFQNDNIEYNYNSQSYALPINQNSLHTQPNIQTIASPKTQNSHSIYNNSYFNGYQPERGYIIQNIQSLGTQETTQTLQTLQNSLTINQNDSTKFNQSQQTYIQNQIQEQKNQVNLQGICLNQSNEQIYNQIQNQKVNQVPSVKLELFKEIPLQTGLQNQEDQQSEIIISQCRILNEEEHLKTSQDFDDTNNLINYDSVQTQQQPISHNLSKLHQFNKESSLQKMQDQRDSSKSKTDRLNNNSNLLRYCYEEKENLNQSQINKKNSTQGYSRYSYMGCLNDYSYLSKKKHKFSDILTPSVEATSILQENDESFNLFSKQFLQSNYINPSQCSEQERLSIVNNRKLSDLNLNFNSEQIYGQNRQIAQKIIVIDQIHENSQSESNISQSCLEKYGENQLFNQRHQIKDRQETEEGNLEINEFENEQEMNKIQVNLVEMKNQSKFLQKY
ncbi:hypothetical protein ABPG74_010701 [Tetrahymena malaccensis]